MKPRFPCAHKKQQKTKRRKSVTNSDRRIVYYFPVFFDPQEEWNVFDELSSELTFTIINTKIGLSVADN